MDSQRALAAIVFTDAVGFAGRANVDEASALEEIERDFAIMRECCARHDGQVLKSLGDGLLMVFSSAVQAVLCSIDIQDRLQKGDGNDPLLHRIGIHLGDVLLSENDAKGDGVNIAARLEQEAPAGGICMSGTIYDVVKSRLTVQVRSRGITQLKNIAEPIQVYEIGPSAETVEKVSLRRRGEPERQSMATTYAIFFLGICILGAAGIYFIANRKQEPEGFPFPFTDIAKLGQNDPSRIIRVGPDGKTEFSGDPTSKEFRDQLEKVRKEMMGTFPDLSAFEEQIRKDERLRAKAGDKEVTLQPLNSATIPKPPSTGGTVEPPPAPATEASQLANYEDARNAYGVHYQFDNMVAWIKQQSWANRPIGGTALRHWEKLVQMKAIMIEAFDLPREESLRDAGELSQVPPGQLDAAMNSWKPKQFRAVAVALALKAGKEKEMKPLLKAFDLEFSTGGLGKLIREQTGKPNP